MNTETRCTWIIVALCGLLLVGALGSILGCVSAGVENTNSWVCGDPNAPADQRTTCQAPTGAQASTNAPACQNLNECMGTAAGFQILAPAQVASGASFRFTVQALNSANGPLTNYTGTVHFVITGNVSSSQPPADAQLVNGSGTFSAKVSVTAPGSITIAAFDTGNNLIAGIANIQITTAVSFTVTAPPAVASGIPFTFTVTAVDASAKPVPSYAGKVHFGAAGSGGKAVTSALPADTQLTNGTGTFNAILDEGGSPVQTLSATDTVGGISGQSKTISVTAASFDPASSLQITAPASVVSLVPFTVTVTALNDSGKISVLYPGTIHFSASGHTGTADLPDDSKLTNGTGTFSVTLGEEQTLTVADKLFPSISGQTGTISVQVPSAPESLAPSARLQSSAPATLPTAPPCPAIVFNQPQNLNLFNFDINGQSFLTTVLYRQLDGNFTAEGFSIPATASDITTLRANAVGTHLGSIPQAQRYFANCRGLAPWAPAPHPTILAGMPGTMSQRLVIANLGGATYAEINANAADSSISVSLDNQGTLGKSTTVYPVGGTPSGVLTADFNGDGKPDVAVLNKSTAGSPGSVSILLGLGGGLLGPAKTFTVGVGPLAMTSYDFNNDGHADIAAVNQTDNTVTVLIANSDGSMKPGVTYSLPGTAAANVDVVAADYDGDGKPDVMAYSANGFSLLHGNGDGTFQLLAQKTNYNVKFNSRFLAPGDFNKDGHMDLASYNSDGTVTILVNGGDGSFSTTNRYVAGTLNSAGDSFTGMFATDFNDDGKLDLVFGMGHPDAILSNPAFVTLLLGNGDGTLQAPPAQRVGQKTTVMAAADLNSDTRLDLAVAGDTTAGTPGVWILPGAAGGGFQTPLSLSAPSSGSQITWLAIGDVNGDGKKDIAAVDDAGKLFTWMGNGFGTFAPAVTYNAGATASFVTVADINHDGAADVFAAYGTATATTGSVTQILMSLGSAAGIGTGVLIPTGVNPMQVAVADVNGDGKPDLIVVNHGVGNTGLAAAQPVSGDVAVLLGNGDGTFQLPVRYPVGLNPISVAVSDVNGDGKPDLLVGTVTSTAAAVGVLLNSGNGSFGNATLVPTYAWPSNLTVADFDGDGKPDMAIVHVAKDPPMSIMRGNGDGTFAAETLLFAGSAPQSAIAGNFSGHGKQDLVVSNFASGTGASGTVNLFANLSGILPSATHFSISAPASVTPGTAFNMTVTALDGGGNIVTSYSGTVHFTSSDAAAVLPGNATLTNGTGNFSATLKTLGSQTITATDTATSIAGSTAIATGAGAATHLSVSTPATATAGTVFFVVVTALDANNNTVPSYSGTVHFTSSDGAAVLPANAMLTNGTGTFPATLKTAGSNTISATDTVTSITGTSGAIAVSAASGGTPAVVSASPVASTGSSQTYTFQFSDTLGASSLAVVNVLMNQYLDGRGACYIAYSVPDNVLYLVPDAGGGLLPGILLNGSGSTSNSQCSIAGNGSLATVSGNNLTLTLKISFNSSFGGNKVVYAAARETINNSGWNVMGVHGVPPLPATFPTAVGMSPASSTASSEVLTFTYQDATSAASLQTMWALTNTAIDGRAACYVAFYAPGNQIFLVPDNGDGSQATSMSLSGTGTLSNSQCTVSAAGSSYTTSGPQATLMLNIAFKPAFAGRKDTWLAVQTLNAAATSDWQALGARTVPGS